MLMQLGLAIVLTPHDRTCITECFQLWEFSVLGKAGKLADTYDAARGGTAGGGARSISQLIVPPAHDYIMAPQRGRPYGANLGSMGREGGKEGGGEVEERVGEGG